MQTILSQHTSDANTERAFASLRAQFATWDEVIAAPTSKVADAIRGGGLADQKAPRIRRVLAEILAERGSFELDDLADLPVGAAREWLMQFNGIGPKTASCVLLFSLGMPALPVDTHVHRVARRIGLIDEVVSAEQAHELLESALGANRDTVYAFHVNMITHGRSVCQARRPKCGQCPIADCCVYVQRLSNNSRVASPSDQR
ncbi:MAG: endonuclease III domain-containing protein [Thermomicrobiales bacterium]